MAFVQSGKMSLDDAKLEILKTFKDSCTHIRTIEFTVVRLNEIQRSEKIRLRCIEIAKTRFPRRIIPAVDEVFLPHMLEKEKGPPQVFGFGRPESGGQNDISQITRNLLKFANTRVVFYKHGL